MTPRVRLAVLTVVVGSAGLALALSDVVSAEQLRDVVDRAGPFAPLAWVVLSCLLGAALFPGPVLAGASGLLFGAFLGTVTTIASSVLSALVSREIGFRAGREGAAELIPIDLSRGGLETVVVQRLLPGVPDAPLSYAFGALGVTRREMALGTAIGSLPRAFSYTAIGASLDDPSSPLGYAGVIGVVLSAVLGLEAGRRLWRGRSAVEDGAA